MAKKPRTFDAGFKDALYYRADLNAYECLGCNEMIEVPRTAILKIEGIAQRVTIHDNPEHRMLWRELHELDHADCAKYQDAEKAKAHREFRK